MLKGPLHNTIQKVLNHYRIVSRHFGVDPALIVDALENLQLHLSNNIILYIMLNEGKF